MLLTKLSEERRECVLFCQGRMFCSCGHQFDDVCELENHFVRHDRPTKCRPLNFRDIQRELVELAQRLNDKRAVLYDELYGSTRSLIRLSVPESNRYVLLGESQLNVAPLNRVKCSECGQVCLSFSELQDHFRQWHPRQWQPAQDNLRILTQPAFTKEKGLKYAYFCPIPGCKYHVLNVKSCPMASLKLLKQHYSKVHSKRTESCERCAKTFVNPDDLQRHWKGCVGQSFQCSFCPASYNSFETLQTHSRRKHKISIGKRSQKVKNPGLDSAEYRPAVPLLNERGEVKIAPRPSYLHLNAALALSELSSSQKVSLKVNRGIQKDFEHQALTSSLHQHPTFEEGVKRSAETQTGTTPVKKRLSRLMDPLQVILTTEEQQTQTPTRRDFDESTFSDVALALRSERPVWAASSTQTSPRIPDTCNSLIKDCLLPSDGVRLAVSGNSSHTNSISTSTVREGALQRPPKLADIEQFSTETQTDFVSQGVGVSADWDLSFEQFDAGTQFDLDDILCSNYTQTVIGTELNLAESPTSCHVADMINAVHSIETQTISDQINKAQSSMETQTVLEEFI